ncbi:MAG: response regulator [Mariniblastus sp.]
MKKIAIIDDHPAIRDGLSTRVSLENDLEVCGGAADVVEGLALIEREQPDLAIVDISLKTGNGIDLIKQAKEKFPNLKMLVWSMYDESLYAERALRAGAMGYINKENVTDTIIEAIRTVLAGQVFLSQDMSAKVLQGMVTGKRSAERSPVESLSDRELETFQLMGQGLNTVEIAKRMHVSPKTVETYRTRIKEKIQVKDMSELMREATRWFFENA